MDETIKPITASYGRYCGQYLEKYLKAIYEISCAEEVVRVKNIATHVGVSFPSVTIALRKLNVFGYVSVENRGLILLTKKGMELAKGLEKTTLFIKTVLNDFLGVPEDSIPEISYPIDEPLEKSTEERMDTLISILKRIQKEGETACPELIRFLKNV